MSEVHIVRQSTVGFVVFFPDISLASQDEYRNPFDILDYKFAEKATLDLVSQHIQQGWTRDFLSGTY